MWGCLCCVLSAAGILRADLQSSAAIHIDMTDAAICGAESLMHKSDRHFHALKQERLPGWGGIRPDHNGLVPKPFVWLGVTSRNRSIHFGLGSAVQFLPPADGVASCKSSHPSPVSSLIIHGKLTETGSQTPQSGSNMSGIHVVGAQSGILTVRMDLRARIYG